MLADVEVDHGPRPAARRIQREAAGEAEGIQYNAAFGEGLHSAAVLTLVEKETGLLTAQHVGLEAQAVFEEQNWRNRDA